MTTNQNDPDRIMQMIIGYWVTQVVHAAATFSIADHLAKTPATANDIADAEGTDPSATFRLLRFEVAGLAGTKVTRTATPMAILEAAAA